ncbi:MAG: adenylosuccinate synthetase, partial [Bacteroidota bacterium]|nr:adenylosuccinate synthetase [Bacteroidota bacterium]
GVRSREQFPQELKEYITFLEKELKIPVKYVSVGPDREQIIEL